jgi:hypothetical protein
MVLSTASYAQLSSVVPIETGARSLSKPLSDTITLSMAHCDATQPFVKLSHSFFKENFTIYSASMRTRLMQLHLFVYVSLLDENTHSQGTADAWIGR